MKIFKNGRATNKTITCKIGGLAQFQETFFALNLFIENLHMTQYSNYIAYNQNSNYKVYRPLHSQRFLMPSNEQRSKSGRQVCTRKMLSLQTKC